MRGLAIFDGRENRPLVANGIRMRYACVVCMRYACTTLA